MTRDFQRDRKDTDSKGLIRAPDQRDPSGWSAPDSAPFIDTVTGIEYPSRNQLKKAVRIRLSQRGVGYLGHELNEEGRVPKVTLTEAVRSQIRREMNLPKMAETHMDTFLSSHKFKAMVEEIVTNKMHALLGTRRGFNANTHGAEQLEKLINAAIDKSVRSMVTKIMKDAAVDIAIGGRVHTTPKNTRHIDLGEPDLSGDDE